jgi:hypothetical protein
MSLQFLDSVPLERAISAIYLVVRLLRHKAGLETLGDPVARPTPAVRELVVQIITELEEEADNELSEINTRQAERLISSLSEHAVKLVSRKMGADPEFGERLLDEMRRKSLV